MTVALDKQEPEVETAVIDELEPITIGSLVELTAGPSPGGGDDNVVWGT